MEIWLIENFVQHSMLSMQVPSSLQFMQISVYIRYTIHWVALIPWQCLLTGNSLAPTRNLHTARRRSGSMS